MKYNIISLNDKRLAYKENIRKYAGGNEFFYPAVDGRLINFEDEYIGRDIPFTGWSARKGEVGVWLSNFDRWMEVRNTGEEMVVFEDDAIIDEHFDIKLSNFKRELPQDWDFASLWVPENQHQDYRFQLHYDHQGDPIITGQVPYQNSRFKHSMRCAKVYQGYGMVAVMYSPKGAEKLIALARKHGIYTPVDCFMYQQAHMGNLNGYSPTPLFADIVTYDWQAETNIHDTERVTL